MPSTTTVNLLKADNHEENFEFFQKIASAFQSYDIQI
jgi:hypothetical protein